MSYRHIDLFSGIGGFALAAQWAGLVTEVFCEIDPFCQEVLKKRFGAVEKSERCGCLYRENGEGQSKIRGQWDTGAGDGDGIHNQPLLIPDIRDFDGTGYRGAFLLTGGFPCQPFSCAGKRKGKSDDRYIWPEMLRVISESKPAWVLGENVAGIINMELEQVCLDLEAEGYEVQPLVIPACAVNAPHRRDRVWIVANNGKFIGRAREESERQGIEITNGDSDAADTCRERLEVGHGNQNRRGAIWEEGQTIAASAWQEAWPEVATRLCRVDARPTRRVDRLRALGNAIVPRVAYEIIKAMVDIAKGEQVACL